jgi:siroheme decarboxylase
MVLDSTDRKLLNTIQTEFPLVEKPFDDLGNRLGITPEEVISRLARLKSEHVIRMIGPVIDGRCLGFSSSLIAAKVPSDRLVQVEKTIFKHEGVSHGYERDHEFNVWFTLVVGPEIDLNSELEHLNCRINAEKIVSLTSLKVFKIGAYFDMEENSRAGIAVKPSPGSKPVQLTAVDKAIINQLQQDLALVPFPFEALAGSVNLPVEAVLIRCRALIEQGVIRRFSASINHRQAGFTANAMCCWAVPAEDTDAMGEKLSSLRQVSHCYERKTSPGWRYNLFAMIHGHSREACQGIADKISSETGQFDAVVLYSTKEFKKQRVKYQL